MSDNEEIERTRDFVRSKRRPVRRAAGPRSGSVITSSPRPGPGRDRRRRAARRPGPAGAAARVLVARRGVPRARARGRLPPADGRAQLRGGLRLPSVSRRRPAHAPGGTAPVAPPPKKLLRAGRFDRGAAVVSGGRARGAAPGAARPDRQGQKARVRDGDFLPSPPRGARRRGRPRRARRQASAAEGEGRREARG